MYIKFNVYNLCILEDINAQTGVTTSGTPDILSPNKLKITFYTSSFLLNPLRKKKV